MFTPPPLEWVEECQRQRAWQAKQEENSASSTREETLLAVAKQRPHETKHVCLFTEEELNQPTPARKKKPAPADGVFFF